MTSLSGAEGLGEPGLARMSQPLFVVCAVIEHVLVTGRVFAPAANLAETGHDSGTRISTAAPVGAADNLFGRSYKARFFDEGDAVLRDLHRGVANTEAKARRHAPASDDKGWSRVPRRASSAQHCETLPPTCGADAKQWRRLLATRADP
ncbi:MAG: hypothetical protein NVSMB6_18830 [Burkholderiaceae bacterium]